MGDKDNKEASPQDDRKIQKLRMRVRHLDEELEQAEDLKSDYDKEFDEMSRLLRVHLGLEDDTPTNEKDNTLPTDTKNEPTAGCSREHQAHENKGSQEKPDEKLRQEIENNSASAPAWMKKAYKQIAMKTHPDRVAQDTSLSPYQVAEYRRLFDTAKTAIQEQNGGDIVYVAEQLNIEAGIPAATRIALLYSRAESTREKIKKIQRSPQWAWGESYGNRPMRKKIVEMYCKLFKYSINDASVIDKFLDKLEGK